MRFLRWAALALVLVGGALGLGAREASAAALPSAGLSAQSNLAGPVAEHTQYYYRRPYYRRFYGYRRPYFRRRFYGYRPYYRRRFYRRGFYY